MCSRFTLAVAPVTFQQRFDLDPEGLLEDRAEWFPTDPILLIRTGVKGARELTRARWGFVPGWSKHGPEGRPLINARAESLHERPSFRPSLQSKRCLIPATCFYEWPNKVKHRFSLPDGRPFAMAGLWDEWTDGGVLLESCCVITVDANDQVRPLHDRMPAILTPEDEAVWLRPRELNMALSCLRPYEDTLQIQRV